MGVKVVNKATGEYIEFDYQSFEDFADQYDELTQQIAALERAKKKMGDELKQMMGDEKQLEVGAGRYFSKAITQRKAYNAARVMEILEDDAVRYLTVVKTKLDNDLKEDVANGGPLARVSKELQDALEVDQTIESIRLIKPKS